MDTYPFFKIVCVHIYFVNELRCMNESNRFGNLIFTKYYINVVEIFLKYRLRKKSDKNFSL